MSQSLKHYHSAWPRHVELDDRASKDLRILLEHSSACDLGDSYLHNVNPSSCHRAAREPQLWRDGRATRMVSQGGIPIAISCMHRGPYQAEGSSMPSTLE